MESSAISQRSARVRRLRLVVSVLAISLVAAAALIVPYVVRVAHAAAPTHAASNCAQPPAGADPTTFTKQQLALYGLPAHLPGQSQAKWASMVRHAKHRFCFPPSAASPVAMQHGLMQPLSAHDIPSCQVSCFAGLQGDSPNTPMTSVSSSWVIPCVSGAPNTTAAIWIGMGDLNGGGPFLRVGVIMHEVYFTIPTPAGPIVEDFPEYFSYFQDTGDPNNADIQSGPTVNCGDTVDAFISENDPQPNPWQVGIYSETSGYYFDITEGANVDASAAACGVEDPGNGAQPLFDFGAISFNDCIAFNGGDHIAGMLGYSPNMQWNMSPDQNVDDPWAMPVNISSPDGRFFDVDAGLCWPPPPENLC